MRRVCEIAYLLLKSETPVTIDTIAYKLGVSNKTIRNDLKEVEEYLEDNGLLLSRKPGVGTTIEGPEESKLRLINDIKFTPYKPEPFSPEDRKNFILIKLFLSQKGITIGDLAKELYMSKSTIRKDLINVNEWLKDFDLKLVKRSNYMIEIAGNEKNCRNAIANLITNNKELHELKEMLFKGSAQRIDYPTMAKLKDIIDIDFLQLENIVADAEKTLGLEFSYIAFISLIIHIAISIKRLNDGNSINLSDTIMSELREKDEYIVAKQIADDIYQNFKVKLPEQEIGYILLHILGTKLERDLLDNVGIELKNEVEHELPLIMAKEIIHIAERALHVDFSKDEQLLNGLMLHLRPTINRLKYDLNLKNPILDQIRESYPEVYGVAWMTNKVFQQYLGKRINEDEVGYISMHLAAAMEKQNHLIRTLVVCTSGIGSSQLLTVKLKTHFAQLDIKDVTSAFTINDAQLNNIDMIISTVPINVEKPVLYISPLFTQNDIERTINFINNLNKKDSSQLFMEDFIYVNASLCRKNDVIKSMATRLFEKGFVKEGFERSVFAREEIGCTEIGNGVVVTHGFPKHVNMSQISVAILKKPIKWEHNKVDIIFMIALSRGDIKKNSYSLEGFYRALDSDNFLSMLRKANSKEEVKEMINNVC